MDQKPRTKSPKVGLCNRYILCVTPNHQIKKADNNAK